MPETRAPDVSPVLAEFADDRANLIPLLQEIQGRFFYLPEEALRRVARKLHVPITEVYQVATFYRCFSLKPRGRHLVQVCLGTACHVRGGDLLLERAQSEAGTALNGTSPDLEFTVEPVRCLGCCGLAPVMRVDRDTFAHLEQAKVRGVLNRYRPKRKPAAARASAPTSPTSPESAAHD